MYALVFMMWNKQIRILGGILGIIVFLFPVTDLLFALLLRAGANGKDKPRIKAIIIIAIIPFIIISTSFCLMVSKNKYKARGIKDFNSAVEQNDYTYVQGVLNRGDYKFDKDDNINTPLISAVKKQNTKMVKLLLENGANANEVDVNRDSTFYFAYLKDNNEIINQLIGHGAKINDEKAFFALIIRNNLPMLKRLESLGADFNDRRFAFINI